MSQISANDVKTLREMTGAGMMDCKKALVECGGDLEAAVDHLRKKGLSAAAKKAGRVAAEGLVAAISQGNCGVVLEVNSETDFVSKNDQFIGFVNQVAKIVLEQNPADLDALAAQRFDDEVTVGEKLGKLIATIGENMNIRRFARVQVEGGVIAAYVHAGGRIATLVGIEANDNDAMRQLSRNVAMHIAAANPRYIRPEEVAAEELNRERAVLTEKAAISGKPANIIEKMVDGQLRKFYSEICLLEQTYVLDQDVTVGKAISNAQKDAKIVAMHRYQLGEGIEKVVSDFAAEVAAQVNG